MRLYLAIDSLMHTYGTPLVYGMPLEYYRSTFFDLFRLKATFFSQKLLVKGKTLLIKVI